MAGGKGLVISQTKEGALKGVIDVLGTGAGYTRVVFCHLAVC